MNIRGQDWRAVGTQVFEGQLHHWPGGIMEHCGAADAEGHDDQADAEEGVQLADDLVDGEHGCQEVVDQNDDGPESDAEGAWRQQGQKAGRPYHEDDADTQQQNDGKRRASRFS